MASVLNKNDLNYIKEIIVTNTMINDKYIDINIKCWMTYGVYEEYRVARIFDSYIMTYINGVEKEYKRRRAALNAILKVYNTINQYNEILKFKVNEPEIKEITNNIYNEVIKSNGSNINKEDNKKECFYISNLNFNSYKEAYDYCISKDLDPDLMINRNGLKSILDFNKIKIKLLDKKIDRLLYKRLELKESINKKGIKYNNINNSLIQQLNNLDNLMDNIEKKIDKIKYINKNIEYNNYKIYSKSLYKEYGDAKYRVIHNIDNTTMFTNNIEKYLYNKKYNIKFILEDREVYKQYIYNNKNGFYKVYYYKNNDSNNIIEKKEIYSLKDNRLIYKQLRREKNNIRLLYSYLNDNELLLINGKNISIYSLNKAMTIFKNDSDIINVLEKYIVIEPTKQPKTTTKERIELTIKDYQETVNKFPKLKYICDNIKYYNILYKDNYNLFYRKYKTNKENFSNYLYNYRYLNKLLKTNKEIKEFTYKIPKKVIYTTCYRKGAYIK